MSATDEDFDDMHCPLSSMNRKHSSRKVTTQLVDIQQAQVENEKSREFLAHLECLRFTGHNSMTLVRQNVNAYKYRRYVALSYTWEPSSFETNLNKGAYSIQGRRGYLPISSPVRDEVFARAKKYMEYYRVPFLWIDQHCIDQEDEEAKEIGMNAMDRVYSRSSHPVALLTRPINSSTELWLLYRILNGQLSQTLSRRHLRNDVSKALKLLKDITSDMWYTRGWTFQEDYKGGLDMRLLMPHHSSLTSQIRLFGMESIEGELCIYSKRFQTQATRFCLAYRKYHGDPTGSCEFILSRVGKYTILLQREDADGFVVAPRSMTPVIISDLSTRTLKDIWDRLPIAANCCQYSVRLNSTELRAKQHSLSLSMLALCLLNGEILSNNPNQDNTTRKTKIIDFLKEQFFNKIRSPYVKRGLTYNKGCRLVDVELGEEGIHSRGHLWKCERLISTKRLSPSSRPRKNITSGYRLARWQVFRLKQLIGKLHRCGERKLVNNLRGLLDIMNFDCPRYLTFSQKWKLEMASILAHAIDDGFMLCTAHLLGSRNSGSAIFIVERDYEHCSDRKYIFTSIRSGKYDSATSDSNVDKHVSMEVDVANPKDVGQHFPLLFTKRWINGLCFFSGDSLREVVFPWPTSLQNL